MLGPELFLLVRNSTSTISSYLFMDWRNVPAMHSQDYLMNLTR
jgi:hypothetical protein